MKMMGRVALNLNLKQIETLEFLANNLGTTKTDVIRRALVFLELSVKETKKGNRVAIIKNKKILKEIVLI